MTNHEDPANPSRLRGAGTEGYMAPVSARVRVNTNKADLFRRNNKNQATSLRSPRNRSTGTDYPLIPTSGPLAQ